MAKQQEKTSRIHERAYIVCGGLYGVPKYALTSEETYRPKASHFKEPWIMVIYNFGRTPGCITKIEWGVCPEKEFISDKPVSKLIKTEKFEKWMKPVVDVQELFAPIGRPIPYRYVQCDRIVGEVFFGKISYKDVFDDPHHSTFALLHREEHTDSIGRSFADDQS